MEPKGQHRAAFRLIDALRASSEHVKTRLRASHGIGVSAALEAEIEERGGEGVVQHLTEVWYRQLLQEGYAHPLIVTQKTEATSIVAFLSWVRREFNQEASRRGDEEQADMDALGLTAEHDVFLFSAICDAVLGQLTSDLPRWRARQQTAIA